METVTVVSGRLWTEIGAPVFGRQDIGWSPGGAIDRFSVQTGNIMLGNPEFAAALEIVHAPALEFREDCLFVLTGAQRKHALLSIGSTGHSVRHDVPHAAIIHARPGDRLALGAPAYGFRTYLCYAACGGQPSVGRRFVLRVRPPFEEIASWPDSGGAIRVMEGPEHDRLADPGAFTGRPWTTSTEMDDMGIRLFPGDSPLEARGEQMVSQPLTDGTVQLTPSGPIILLRKRPTIGGYPRIFTVLGADLDLLAQCGPRRVIHFRQVSREEAVEAARRKQDDIERFRRRWNEEVTGDGHARGTS